MGKRSHMRILLAIAAVLSLVLGLARPGVAANLPSGAIALSVGASYTFSDGVQVSVTGLSCGAGVSCSDLWMVPQTGISNSVIIEAASGIGQPLESIMSYTCPSGLCSVPATTDLSVQLTAKSLVNGVYLTGASAAISGTADSGYGAAVNMNESLAGSGGAISGAGCSSGQLNVTLLNASTSSDACTFAKQTYVQGTKDAAISGMVWSGTYALNTITESFSAVPEPASMASLISGVVALAALRGRRRRRA